ncbi:MAG: SusD/RagB family nutrient-binding outer membrane lipoprotein [Bacteroidales bacterium]|nr:SusD/RagB family nutrient-binding outer membrane lipoprotein [Bacteroidales bacterium]
MKRIYLVFIILVGIMVSCTDNFEDFNTDKKNPTDVPGNFLFANAQKALADQVASTNVNLNIFKLIAQYWTETTYTDESNYDIITRTIPDLKFRTYYRDILKDFQQAKMNIASEEVAGDDAITAKANRQHIIDLLMAYSYQRLVDMFGNIPYADALDIENISPAYEDAYGIYKDLIEKVKAATDGLDASGGSFDSDDLYFGGDVAMWKKFGNSLLVKLGIALVDYDNALAKTTIEGAYAGAFGPNERCELVYLGGSNSNPLYVDLVQSGRHDFVPANTLVDMMNTLEDPRRPMYFEINGDEYTGGIYGESNNFSQYSHIADPIQEPTFPMTLLDGTEISFYLAEAAEHGFSVGGSAEEHYNNGISSSFAYWGLSEADANAYLAKPEVAYSTAAGDWKQKIGTQAWLAYYVRGMIAWNSWRRLDQPTLNLPPAPETDDGQVPKRYTYPVNEQTLNAANRAAAVQAMGGQDRMSLKLFWDVN